MEQAKVLIFLILFTIIVLFLIVGLIFFVLQYQRKKRQHEQEKAHIAEEHLKELFFTKLEIQQHTMQEIGREIHDSVNQQLTLASLYTYQLESEHENTRTGERVSRIGNIINDSMAELRDLSKKLTHDAESSTLFDLVNKECTRINSLNSCKADYHFNESDIPLSPTLINYLHRIIQEFLQNSIKHADCKNINLTFNLSEQGLYILLKDDGKGFDMDAYETSAKGIGLANMKKRSNLLGIEFSLQSKLNKGTEVKLFIPKNKLNISPDGIQNRYSG